MCAVHRTAWWRRRRRPERGVESNIVLVAVFVNLYLIKSIDALAECRVRMMLFCCRSR